MLDFLEYLLAGNLTPGEKELAYNLTVIYGMSIFSMVILYRFFTGFNSGTANVEKCETKVAQIPNTEDTMMLIKERRTIMPKDFNGEKLETSEVEMLLEAANWAPTHKRCEPWRFTVIAGSENISNYLEFVDGWYRDHKESVPDKDYQAFLKKYAGLSQSWPEQVSHLVIIGMKRQALLDQRLPEWEEICATAMAVQNLHLAATAMEGVAGFWSSHTWCKHARDSVDMLEHLGLDTEDRVFGAFVLGKYDTTKKFRSKRGDWREKVHWRTE